MKGQCLGKYMERDLILLEGIEQGCIGLDGVSTLEEGVERLIEVLGSVDALLNRDSVFRKQLESRVLRIEATVQSVAPLTWVRTQKAPLQFYWSDPRDEVQLAGVGIGHQVSGDDFSVVESLPINRVVHPEKLTGLRYLGTGRFDAKLAADSEWFPFGTNRFYLPLVELRRLKNRCTLACNLFIEGDIQRGFTDHALHELKALNRRLYQPPPQLPLFRGTSEEPDFSTFNGMLREILTRIHGGHLEKVVAARAYTRFSLEPLHPMEIVALLAIQCPDTYLFCVQLDHHLAFLGASPEQLYERNSKSIYSEALAGTRPRGKTPEEDEVLANELVTSDKERREQAIVLDMMMAKLEPFCKKIASENNHRIRRLSNVQHLLTPVRGVLKEGVTDSVLLEALHPTPAVCGYPREEAMEEIRRLEQFDRGLFAGIVGLFGIDRTQVAIGIRSALIHGRKITMYAGAGVVSGSLSSSEWKETEYKMRPFIDILGSRT